MPREIVLAETVLSGPETSINRNPNKKRKKEKKRKKKKKLLSSFKAITLLMQHKVQIAQSFIYFLVSNSKLNLEIFHPFNRHLFELTHHLNFMDNILKQNSINDKFIANLNIC